MNNTYGFIKVLNNGAPYDVFVHANNISITGEYKLKKRDVVSFTIKEEVLEGAVKHVAANVILIQEGPVNTPSSNVTPNNTPMTKRTSNDWSAGETPTSHNNKSRSRAQSEVTASYSPARTVRSANNTPMSRSASISTSSTVSPPPGTKKSLNPEAVEFKYTAKVIVAVGPTPGSNGFKIKRSI